MKTILSLLAVGLSSLSALAQDATVTVLHGVPGLAAPVEVFADGNRLFAFDYGDQRGPLTLAPGSYTLDVRLNGAVILSTNATLNAGDDVSVIAHLDANGGPVLSAFANDDSALTLPASRLTVRHTAQAPAVDIILGQNGQTVATIPNVSNGQEFSTDVAPGVYSAQLNLAGTSSVAFGPVDVVVENGNGYGIFAVGDASAPNFTLLQQSLPLAPRVTVVHGIPALGAPVTVAANTAPLFTFDFRETRGPLVIDSGNYTFDVILNGNVALTGNYTLGRFDDVTVVAHLDTMGAPQLTPFFNDTSENAPGEARVTVRHLADAPAVDLIVSDQGVAIATVPGLTNGNEITAALPLGNLEVQLNAAGTSTVVFGPVNFRPQQNVLYEFNAVGDFNAATFGVEVLQRDLTPAVPNSITTQVGGWSCGPAIGASPTSFDYGEPWQLVVDNAPASAMAIVNFGNSITTLNGIALPLDLQPLGAPGCFLNSNALAVFATMTDAQGELAVDYLIPRAFAAGFGVAYFQVGVLTAGNSLGVVTSEYLQIN